jgi:acetyl esterase
VDQDRVHPQLRAALNAQRRVPLTADNLIAVRQSMVDAAGEEVGPGASVRTVEDVDAGGVPARWYSDGGDRPTLLFAHGGGWVMGDLETHDGLCRAVAAASGWAVLALDYRRAPESPHPAAIHDAEVALAWLRSRSAQPIALAGDSAGGQIAAVTARRQRDAGRPVAGQVLICPALDPEMAYPDLDGYGLHRDEMRFFWDAYAPASVNRDDPDVNPFAAPFAGLPPAVVITAELDVLRDEGERYASALLAAGVPVIATRYLGVNHNFPRKLALFDAAPAAVAQIAAALRLWA